MNFSRIMRKCRINYRYLQTKRDCVLGFGYERHVVYSL